MKLLLTRRWFTDKSTIGELTVDDGAERLCYVLEPPMQGPGATAIPLGTYTITLYPSPHAHQVVPLLQDVAGRTMIEMHPGNYPTDTRGCLLPGLTKGVDAVYGSHVAFEALSGAISRALGLAQSVKITVQGLAPAEIATRDEEEGVIHG
jgi:Family of unknown function (DUF5675)